MSVSFHNFQGYPRSQRPRRLNGLEPGKAVLVGICCVSLMISACKGDWAYGRHVVEEEHAKNELEEAREVQGVQKKFDEIWLSCWRCPTVQAGQRNCKSCQKS